MIHVRTAALGCSADKVGSAVSFILTSIDLKSIS